MSSRFLCVLVAAAALCWLPACDDDPADPVALADHTIAIEATEPSGGAVRLDAPASARAGRVNVTLDNRGSGLHDAQIFRVDGRRSASDIVDVVEAYDYAPKPRWLHPQGGVAAVQPGDTATVTQVLRAGTYFIVDTQEIGKDYRSNASKGGVAKLDVTGTTSDGLPSTPARITARDDGFEATGVEPGDHRVTFENAGREPHQVVALRIRDGVSYAEGKQEVLDDQDARATRWMPVYVDNSHATAVMEAGGRQIAELSLEPGAYVLMCFAEDRKGGPPHLYLGFVSKLVVPARSD